MANPQQKYEEPFIQLTLAKSTDVATLLDLHMKTVVSVCEKISTDCEVNRAFSRLVSGAFEAQKYINAVLADPQNTVLLLRAEGQPIGYAIAKGDRLDAIGVVESERKKGYGTLLFNSLPNAVRKHEIVSPVAHGFFKKLTGHDGQKADFPLFELANKGFAGKGIEVKSFSL